MQNSLQILGLEEGESNTSDENGLAISSAYDIIYGFIMAQEVHVRAELFDKLDRLYYWARKAAGAASIADPNPTSSTDPVVASVSDATDTRIVRADTGESGDAYNAAMEAEK